MTGKRRYLTLLLVVILAFTCYRQLQSSEEQRIQKALLAAAELLERKGDEHPLESLRLAREFAALAADTIAVQANLDGEDYRSEHSRKDLENAVTAARARLQTLDVHVAVESVQVQGNKATVRGIGRALGSMKGAEGKFLEQHRGELQLEKQDNYWLVTGVKSVQIPNNPFKD